MRHLLLTLCILLPLLSFAQEKIDFKVLSYSEFFQMIEDEPSDEFVLKNAVLKFDTLTDLRFAVNSEKTSKDGYYVFERKDTIQIKKKVSLENIINDRSNFRNTAPYSGILNHLNFQEEFNCTNCLLEFYNSEFKKRVRIKFNEQKEKIEKDYYEREYFSSMFFMRSIFRNGISVNPSSFSDIKPVQVQFRIDECEFFPPRNSDRMANFDISGLGQADFNKNIFHGEKQVKFHVSLAGRSLFINDNDFDKNLVRYRLLNQDPYTELEIARNTIGRPAMFEINALNQQNYIDWEQFKYGVFRYSSYLNYIVHLYESGKFDRNLDVNWMNDTPPDSILTDYLQNYRVANREAFKGETSLHGQFQTLYKSKHDTEFANSVFLEIKDLETTRLGFLFEQNPSFDTFFKWKVNQFLKVFSAYGTEPSKAITISVYVILVFALIYLFFPNHWDSHGKDRILHRYQFFFKYLNKDAGMHDVYLDGKKDELAHYDGFKNFFIENGKTVPKFFLATALPLYRWSTASTRSSSWFLQKIDIFKGRWSDLPPAQRAAKTVLLTLAFAIALTYDIFIKMLNALMLSINTFTTLGFGEIPIKGLPRYLAIIQGFIGWFMLTIFSVSLISQLLN